MLEGVRGNTEQGMCLMCYKEEGWSHILRCAESRSWREELVDKIFTSIEPQIVIRRIATIKANDKLQKVGLRCNETVFNNFYLDVIYIAFYNLIVTITHRNATSFYNY
jgi:hypothetical protein